jgi:hypothetical protein
MARTLSADTFSYLAPGWGAFYTGEREAARLRFALVAEPLLPACLDGRLEIQIYNVWAFELDGSRQQVGVIHAVVEPDFGHIVSMSWRELHMNAPTALLDAFTVVHPSPVGQTATHTWSTVTQWMNRVEAHMLRTAEGTVEVPQDLRGHRWTDMGS